MANKAVFKFNNGNLAMLCSGCSTILKTGINMTAKERASARGEAKTKARYCPKCFKHFKNLHCIERCSTSCDQTACIYERD